MGASDRPGNWSMRVFQTLRRFTFPGPIYPVNPRNKTVWDGETCYPVARRPAGSARPCRGDRAGRGRDRHHRGSRQGQGAQRHRVLRRLRRRRRPQGPRAGACGCGRRSTTPASRCRAPIASAISRRRYRFMTIPDDRIAELELGPVAIVGQSGGIVMAIQRALHARGVKTSYAITQRQRDRPLYLGLHPLSRRRSACAGDRLLHRVDPARRRVPPRLRARAQRRQAGGRDQDRRLRGKPHARRWRIPARSPARCNASTPSPRPSA